MSSPEAHSRTPQNPDELPINPRIEEFVADKGNYAYSAEGAEPEMTELSPEERVRMENEIRAERTVEQVQQLWNETDDTTRRAIWMAMEDNAAVKRDQADAKEARFHVRNDQKSGKMDILQAEMKEETKALEEEKARNKARKGEAHSRKTGRMSNKIERKRAQIRFQLVPADEKITHTIENRSENTWIDDADRQTESYKQLRKDLSEIDEQAEARKSIRAKLNILPADDPQRSELQAVVDQWGEEPDEMVYAKARQEVATKYYQNLEEEKKKNKEVKWTDEFAKPDEDTDMNVRQVIEKYIKDGEALNDDETPQAQKDIIAANRLKHGSTEQYLKNYLIEKGIAPQEDVDHAAEYYKEWLLAQDKKDFDKDMDAARYEVIERTQSIDMYLELQETAKKIKAGEISDDATIAQNEKSIQALEDEMKTWNEWTAFSQEPNVDLTDRDALLKLLVEPHDTHLKDSVKQKQLRRLSKSGY